MKTIKLIVIALALVTGATAAAGKPGFSPAGVPGSILPIATQPIAQYRFSIGFSIEPGYETVTINDDGSVVYEGHFHSRNGTPRDFVVQVATLSGAQIAALMAKATVVRASDLIDPQAGQPQCMDAPSKSFSVFQAGQEIEIEGHHGCHKAVNETSDAMQIVAILKGLVALAHLQ